jgi:hypothetical protein
VVVGVGGVTVKIPENERVPVGVLMKILARVSLKRAGILRVARISGPCG